jgi:hypothetical protein
VRYADHVDMVFMVRLSASAERLSEIIGLRFHELVSLLHAHGLAVRTVIVPLVAEPAAPLGSILEISTYYPWDELPDLGDGVAELIAASTDSETPRNRDSCETEQMVQFGGSLPWETQDSDHAHTLFVVVDPLSRNREWGDSDCASPATFTTSTEQRSTWVRYLHGGAQASANVFFLLMTTQEYSGPSEDYWTAAGEYAALCDERLSLSVQPSSVLQLSQKLFAQPLSEAVNEVWPQRASVVDWCYDDGSELAGFISDLAQTPWVQP